eukprot:153619-Prymnesium_polylepis.1
MHQQRCLQVARQPLHEASAERGGVQGLPPADCPPKERKHDAATASWCNEAQWRARPECGKQVARALVAVVQLGQQPDGRWRGRKARIRGEQEPQKRVSHLLACIEPVAPIQPRRAKLICQINVAHGAASILVCVE